MIWKNRMVPWILLFCFILSSFSGCGKEIETKKDQQELVEFVPLTEIKEGRPDIYVIVKSMSSSYWSVVLSGTKQAGLDLDCNIYAAGSKLESEWQVQEQYIEKALELGADGIILGPDSSVKLVNAVEKVKKTNTPIIIVDTIVNTDDYDVCFMTDNLLAGENSAREMIEQFQFLGYTNDDEIYVAIQLGAKESQTINERLSGFCQYWTMYAPESWVLMEEIICNDGDEELAKELSNDFLKRNPEVNGVFGTDNASTMGYASALMEQDRKDIVMVGFDFSPEAEAIVESGEYHVSIMLQNQYLMGYRGVEAVVSFMNGEKSNLKFVDTGVEVLNQQTKYTDVIQQIIKVNRGQ